MTVTDPRREKMSCVKGMVRVSGVRLGPRLNIQRGIRASASTVDRNVIVIERFCRRCQFNFFSDINRC